MTSLTERPPSGERSRNGDAVRRAWFVLLLLPVSFFAALALAQVLDTAIGHDPSTGTPSHWADAVALVPAGLVFMIPAGFAMIFARRAIKAGHRAGYLPAVVSVGVVIGYAMLNVLNVLNVLKVPCTPPISEGTTGPCGPVTQAAV